MIRVIITCCCFVICLNVNFGQVAFEKYSYERPLMGTTFRIVIYASSQDIAEQASLAAFERIEELNQIFSNYIGESEVSLLSKNESTDFTDVSPDLWKVMVLSEELKTRSFGVFDVNIGRLSKLWRRAIRRQEMPDALQIKDLILKEHQTINLDTDEFLVQLPKDALLDFGAIAKGYVVDEAFKVLQAHGLSMVLIDGGGDIYAGDAPFGRSGWQIRVEGMEEVLDIKNEAIASSGSKYQYLTHEDKRYSHIIDPRSGYGVTDLKVTVVKAPSCMLADATASILSILLLESERSAFLLNYPQVIVLP